MFKCILVWEELPIPPSPSHRQCLLPSAAPDQAGPSPTTNQLGCPFALLPSLLPLHPSGPHISSEVDASSSSSQREETRTKITNVWKLTACFLPLKDMTVCCPRPGCLLSPRLSPPHVTVHPGVRSSGQKMDKRFILKRKTE